MAYLSKALINKRLIILERNIRKAEATLGIKVYPWLVKRNVKNQGNSMDTALTTLQVRFCEEYPKDMNATQAAVRAGYSEKGAATQGCILLKMPKVQAKIAELNKNRLKRLNITQDNVIKEIALIAFSNISRVAKWTNHSVTLRDSSRLTEADTACIQAIEEKVGKYGNQLKLKLYDKPSALVVLCRYLNILDGNANVTDPADTAKKFKDAYATLFNSVPMEDPNSLADIKNPTKPKPKPKQIQTSLFKQKPGKTEDSAKTDYLMEE